MAGHGSFTAAGRALGYTPSAVSRQISALEAETGARRCSTGSRAGCG
ncbi:LysR family transcriptional regulator [Streptomyces sp. NPDC008139]